MRKLNTEKYTDQLLEVLKGVQALKKRYPDLVNFQVIETHLSSAQKLLHILTLKIKTKENVGT